VKHLEDAMSHLPYNIAHQGASALYPPNTLAAFRAAREAGADIIELDVTYTRDGVAVVSHDLAVDSCTDGHGLIPEMTLAEVKRLDAGVRFGERFRGERIPTLAETLDWLAHNPIRLCIEVKGERLEQYLRAGEVTVDLLRARDCLRWVTLTSFSGELIGAMKAHEPRLSWGYDPDEYRTYAPWEVCEEALACGASFLLHRHSTLAPETVDEAHQHGFAVWAWTVDEPAGMRRLMAMGVDGIMTNRPDVLAAVRKE
jgi:glycerophosphoryl diester phosphodiesterase